MSLYNRRRMLRDRLRGLAGFVLATTLTFTVDAQDIAVSNATVPVVGAVVGLDQIEWRTDVALYNDKPHAVQVILTLPGVEGDPFLFTTVPPKDSITLPDVARSTFGVVGTLSPLRISTLSAYSVTVAAVTQGLTKDGPTEPQVLTVQYGDLRSMLEALPGLTINDTFRTNIGLVNPTERDATIVLALQKIPGRNIAVVKQTLPPLTHVQRPMQDFFPLLTRGENLTVVVEHTNPGAYAYASVVANATGNARYYGPR